MSNSIAADVDDLLQGQIQTIKREVHSAWSLAGSCIASVQLSSSNLFHKFIANNHSTKSPTKFLKSYH